MEMSDSLQMFKPSKGEEMHAAESPFKWIFRFILLYVLFIVFFAIGAMAVGSALPADATSEPGLVSPTSGLLIIALADVLVISSLILTSHWSGWKLAVSLALAYYGAVTFVIQLETWHFLSSITVGPQLLPRLFLMGVPNAFVFIPLAVWILGKGRDAKDTLLPPASDMPAGQWLAKLAALVVSYLVLYLGAGYFIAWQNPALRAFYGQPGEVLPFFEQMAGIVNHDPMMLPLQVLRSLLWIVCALPIIRGSKVNAWWTALAVGLLFSIPQNISLIIANPLMPIASVRMSHLIETSSSTFIFGAIAVWLLHRGHTSFGDLIGIQPEHRGI